MGGVSKIHGGFETTHGATRAEYEAALELTEEQRKNYFKYRNKPVSPARHYKAVPGYVGFAFKKAWMFVVSILIFIVMSIIGTCVGGVKEHTFTDYSVEQRVEEKKKEADENNKKLSKKEIKEMYEKFTADSLETVTQDSMLHAQGKRIFKKHDEESGKNWHYFIQFNFWGILWILLILSPLIYWIIKTWVDLSDRMKKRKYAIIANSILDKGYVEEMELYENKPTDAQMSAYIRNFLSTVVDTELEYHKKSEEDFKGMTLFLNSYFNYKDEGENYNDSAIEYTIVLLEEKCATVIRCDWRVYEDNQDIGEIEQVSYKNIQNVKLTEDELTFGKFTIEIPDEQVFEYQNDDDDDEFTFSNTRTSDVSVFAVGLRKLLE